MTTSRTVAGRLVTALLLVALATGCGAVASDGGPPEGPATVTGTASSVEPVAPLTEGCIEPDPNVEPDQPVSSSDPPVCTDLETAPLGTVLVEEDPSSDSGNTKIVFAITRDTAIWVENADGPVSGTFADIAVGDTVSGWSDGPIAESYPMQATAAAIVVQRR